MDVRVERHDEPRRIDTRPEPQVVVAPADHPAQEEQGALARAPVRRPGQEEPEAPARPRPAERRGEPVERQTEIALVAREEEILERSEPRPRLRDPSEQPVDVPALDPAVAEPAREGRPVRDRRERRAEGPPDGPRVPESEERAQERGGLPVARLPHEAQGIPVEPAGIGTRREGGEPFGKSRGDRGRLHRYNPPVRRLVLLVFFAACAEEAKLPAPEAPSPPDRDTWWNTGTAEAALCPREVRALLAEGRRRGYDADQEWWGRRGAWAAERILELDPDDVEANALSGRRTLQGIEGFEETWRRIVETRAPSERISELLEHYGPWVEEGRPVFLTAEEFEVEKARLAESREYLDRLDRDPGYAAEQRLLLQVKASPHGKYPFVHARAGPFLLFYAARDLARDPEAPPAEEEQRLLGCREIRTKKLEEWATVHRELIDDLRTLYPETWAARAPDPRQLIPQWIFGEREWYTDFALRVRRHDEEAPYRLGFVHSATGWAYLCEPVEASESDLFRESAAYLGALQILRLWARDAKDPTISHWERSEDYWFKEGLPAFLASRRVKNPVEGRALKGPWEMPPLPVVVQRRGPLDRQFYLTPREDAELGPELFPPDSGYTDLAWLLVRHLNGEGRRAAFERFLRAQVDGTGKGIEFFEECFDIQGLDGWSALQRATYASIE